LEAGFQTFINPDQLFKQKSHRPGIADNVMGGQDEQKPLWSFLDEEAPEKRPFLQIEGARRFCFDDLVQAFIGLLRCNRRQLECSGRIVDVTHKAIIVPDIARPQQFMALDKIVDRSLEQDGIEWACNPQPGECVIERGLAQGLMLYPEPFFAKGEAVGFCLQACKDGAQAGRWGACCQVSVDKGRQPGNRVMFEAMGGCKIQSQFARTRTDLQGTDRVSAQGHVSVMNADRFNSEDRTPDFAEYPLGWGSSGFRCRLVRNVRLVLQEAFQQSPLCRRQIILAFDHRHGIGFSSVEHGKGLQRLFLTQGFDLVENGPQPGLLLELKPVA
jgi:hypothetical protein